MLETKGAETKNNRGGLKLTTTRESQLLTQVGPGTAMGNLMRQYWIPAAKSSEFLADGDPVRLLLLGEKLIAFRDSSGHVGVMDHRCPHRCASLFFGRNEKDGLRCVYHGWKFDAEGNCVDMPNLHSHQDFKEKVKAKAYKAKERNGLVWVFMGDQQKVPPLPQLEPALLDEGEARLFFAMRECNWLQALEGDIDTSHFSFLHGGSLKIDQVPEDNPGKYQLLDRAPNYHVTDMEWGTMYGAFRPTEDPNQHYWRVAQFLFPFWTMPPDGDFDHHIVARAWVPMDDTHTMVVHLSWKKNIQGVRVDRNGDPLPGIIMGMEYLPNSTDWYGRWRLAANASNDYMIDREAQRNDEIFTGITGLHLQDQAVTESMGPITDHEWEHLAPSDRMITRTRRNLVKAARALAEEHKLPPGVENPDLFLAARSGDFLAPRDVDWMDAYWERMRASANPTGHLKAAE